MAVISPYVAVPLGVLSLGGAGVLYWVASTRPTRKARALPLAAAIVLTVLGVLLPVLGFDLKHLKYLRRRGGGNGGSAGIGNGTAPTAVMYS